jgi:hypothetical protein
MRFGPNRLRPHVALRLPLPRPVGGRRHGRRTPARAIGLADHPGTWTDFRMRRIKARRCPSPPTGPHVGS